MINIKKKNEHEVKVVSARGKDFCKEFERKTLDHSGQFFDTKSGNLDVAIRFKTVFTLRLILY